jgi:hypothetical protein
MIEIIRSAYDHLHLSNTQIPSHRSPLHAFPKPREGVPFVSGEGVEQASNNFEPDAGRNGRRQVEARGIRFILSRLG